MTQAWYREDLAYIHDVGYSDYALKSAPSILNILAQNNIREGLVVDLGCCSGLSALEFTQDSQLTRVRIFLAFRGLSHPLLNRHKVTMPVESPLANYWLSGLKARAVTLSKLTK